MDWIWHQHHGYNSFGLFFSAFHGSDHKEYTGLWDFSPSPQIPHSLNSLFLLNPCSHWSFCCLFVPWLHPRQSSPLSHHWQLHLQLWDDPMPKLLVAQVHMAHPRPDQRWLSWTLYESWDLPVNLGSYHPTRHSHQWQRIQLWRDRGWWQDIQLWSSKSLAWARASEHKFPMSWHPQCAS